MYITIFDLFRWLEVIVKLLGALLVITVLFGSLITALTFPDRSGGRARISVKPIFTWALTAASTVAVFLQLDSYALVIQRLGEFSGALESLAHLHAASFIALVIVTSARAFFVMSEIDQGRYAGTEKVPEIVNSLSRHRLAEIATRVLIFLALLCFAASCLKVVAPSSAAELPIIGQPTIISSISRECKEYSETVKRLGFNESDARCVKSRLSELRRTEVVSLAGVISGPIELFLIPAYVFMILWCLVICHAARPHIENPRWLAGAIRKQIWIAGLSAASSLLMLFWIHLAIAHDFSFLRSYGSDYYVKGVLTILSLAGVVLVLVSFGFLGARLASDYNMLIELAARRRRSRDRGPPA